ncbi:hypothetical protein AQUCO_00500130v1 [Aquilegia coerulea]|uniref:SGNH hydrolase-type esterase domain-containing protein n=1 Tax=Aquilegia coerulea TaxID=218851 RepID=A0A2G5EQG1_AQUCA|nr:hypothetical protein AQUCO_00500130v1 [Aquilegia coerulea]
MTSIRVVVMVVMATVVVFALTERPICVQGRNIHHSGDQLASRKNVSCILVFGDSSVDPGNNNHLNTSFKANFPPYGKNLANGQCTGRFTNGRLPTDMTAESLGIKKMIPAFLDPKLKKEDLLTGISFASSASGYDNLTAQLTDMHNEGATRLVVVGLPPLGCMPLVRTVSGSTRCVGSFNSAAFLMNSKIQDKLAALRSSLRMKIGYEDIYSLFERARKFPKEYGFTETSKGCVGSGEIELGDTCKGQTTCKDPSKYMFWDSVHPTEKMYKIISDDVTRLVKRHILI